MKKIVIIGCGCVLLLLVCSAVAFGLFGYFNSGEKCVFRGPLSSVSSGPCAKNSNSQSGSIDTAGWQKYDDPGYSFSYPAEYFKKVNTDIVYVYAEDPAKSTADFLDNFLVIKDSVNIEVNQANCQSYINTALKDFNSAESTTTLKNLQVETINGRKLCLGEFTTTVNSTVKGTLKQYIYLFLDNGNQAYSLVLTLTDNSKNFEIFDQIAHTFVIK